MLKTLELKWNKEKVKTKRSYERKIRKVVKIKALRKRKLPFVSVIGI